jgi:intracellular septation protein
MKPTIINLLCAGILYVGIILNKSLLRYLLGAALKLQDEGWNILTKRWIGFFIALAILNEIIWRTQTTDIWVNFKVFGILPITFIFTLAQFSTIKKYQIED